jgi:hypothetical protein
MNTCRWESKSLILITGLKYEIQIAFLPDYLYNCLTSFLIADKLICHQELKSILKADR